MVAQTPSQSQANARSRPSFQSSSMAHPTVDSAAYVHEFSLVEGSVSVGAGAMIAPGTAVTAVSGASIIVSDRAQLLPGVIVEATAGPQVTGENGSSCSIWVGKGSAIAHKSLIHSPAFIGENCFVGFRSTIYNARLGDGCVVMMHVLVQDVEVPPGKCIPSGSVITSQHQADQLPSVQPKDIEFVKEVIGIVPGANQRSPNPSRSTQVPIRGNAARQNAPSSYSTAVHLTATNSTATKGANMQTQRLSPEIVQQVRQHLSQGYRIGMEHADKRHYQSGVWETCTPLKDNNEQAVFSGLERCIAEHEGEYVRMFGIDPKAKRRVGMITVQRPGDKADGGSSNDAATPRGAYGSDNRSTQSGYPPANRNSGSQNNGQAGSLTPGIAQEVRNLLSSGYIIGTEHASPRHYRSNVWKVCSPIESTNEREVFAKLEHCLHEHSGEYIRMFGIDAKAKSRTATTTIQKADGKPVDISAHAVPQASGSSQSQSGGSASSNRYGSNGNGSNGNGSGGYSQGGGKTSDEAIKAVSQILRSGNKIGIEFADKRRYRSGIWQTAPSIKASSESAAISQLQGFLSQNTDKYVRVFSVSSEMKTRGSSMTIQKPGQSGSSQSDSDRSGSSQSRSQASGSDRSRQDPINANPPHYDDPSFRGQPSSYGADGYSAKNAGGMASDVMDQVTQLVNQGHKISIEYADKRRYRSGIWKTGEAINARRPAEAISALGEQLANHKDNYVRLVGTDPKAKRRVIEKTIQRPSQPNYKTVSGTGQDPINANPPHYDDPSFRGQPSSYNGNEYSARNAGGGGGYGNQNSGGNGNGDSGSIASDVMNQVTQLVNQGHKISVEYADKRRYRSGIWKTGEAIEARRPAEAISALGKQLARHQGEYVRLIGTDPQAKRRVLEATIQRP